MSRTIEFNATLMRGGTSKGLFMDRAELPASVLEAGPARDRFFLRCLGSPDPYGKQIDGLGGATSSTSKIVIIGRSLREDSDVDYLFGQVSVDQPVIDWSGNCGNLTAAVGPFAITRGLVQSAGTGVTTVRIWQANIQKRIIAHVKVADGEVVEDGDFHLDGIPFAGAAVQLEFLDPAGGEGLFPTGRPIDTLNVAGMPPLRATCINAGNPTVFVHASSVGLRGTESQHDVNSDDALLLRLEALRAHAAVIMGLADSAQQATAKRPGTPKIAFVSPPADYVASGGAQVRARDVDLVARILSMRKAHHAMTGTGAVAIAAAACLPGTIVSEAVGHVLEQEVRFGHASGVQSLATSLAHDPLSGVRVEKILIDRSARRMMEGRVFVPRASG